MGVLAHLIDLLAQYIDIIGFGVLVSCLEGRRQTIIVHEIMRTELFC